MNNETFNKLYFKAKLGGKKKVGELMIDLIEADEGEHVYQILRQFCPGAREIPTVDNICKDHECDWSPYGFCFTVRMGRTLEQFDPESQRCIWCERIYIPPNTVDPFENFLGEPLRYGELYKE